MSVTTERRNEYSTAMNVRIDKSLLEDFDVYCRDRYVTKTQAIQYLIHHLVKNPGLHPNFGLPVPVRRRKRKVVDTAAVIG